MRPGPFTTVPIARVATHEDITERRQAERRITHLAHYDALTDLQNRALFHERLKLELARIAPGEPGGSSGIVRAIVNIAAERRMTTTAEGVETEAQRDLLGALGCSEMQGWLFSPAKPAAEIKQLLLSHREPSPALTLTGDGSAGSFQAPRRPSSAPRSWRQAERRR